MARLGRTWFIHTISFVVFQLLGAFAHATTIDYSVTHVTGNQWRYDYSVDNDTLLVPITDFTIFFDRNIYSNLIVNTSPVDWDALVVQPDLGIPADGFFDAIALSLPLVPAGILPGGTVSGFSVLFDFQGSGTPGRQAFDIVDQRFNAIDSGFTGKPTIVSEPEGMGLMIVGLVLIGQFIRRPSRCLNTRVNPVTIS